MNVYYLQDLEMTQYPWGPLVVAGGGGAHALEIPLLLGSRVGASGFTGSLFNGEFKI